MATSESLIPFVGSLDNLSFYRMRGSDKIIVRLKGGPSKSTILKSENMERVRENNAEFRGRVLASQKIWRALHPFHRINDYGVINSLHKPLRAIQNLDSKNLRGRRDVCVSRKPMLLEGINFNRKFPFDTVVRTPLSFSVNSASQTATIDIPELIPGLNLMLPQGPPFYQIVVSLAVVTDIHYIKGGYKIAMGGRSGFGVDYHETSWKMVNKATPQTQIMLNIDSRVPDGPGILMLTAGVRMGKAGDTDHPEQVKYIGAAKTLAAVERPVADSSQT